MHVYGCIYLYIYIYIRQDWHIRERAHIEPVHFANVPHTHTHTVASHRIADRIRALGAKGYSKRVAAQSNRAEMGPGGRCVCVCVFLPIVRAHTQTHTNMSTSRTNKHTHTRQLYKYIREKFSTTTNRNFIHYSLLMPATCGAGDGRSEGAPTWLATHKCLGHGGRALTHDPSIPFTILYR